MELLVDPNVWFAFFTLTLLEIVLGIDNIIFISILAAKLPEHQQAYARRIGLLLAMAVRIALLFFLTYLMKMEKPLFSVGDHDFSMKDVILIAGGLFLLVKSTLEIHENIQKTGSHEAIDKASATLQMVVLQIVGIDIVFSIDSIVTAIGIAKHIEVMVAAVIVSIGVMMIGAELISKVIERQPTLKILALSFLMLIGMALTADGLGFHIPKGYLYFAMAFSVIVEVINIRIRENKAKSERANL